MNLDSLDKKNSFYQQTWFVIFMLVFFFPVGLFLMWKHGHFSKKAKVIITAFFVLITMSSLSDTEELENNKTITETSIEKPVEKTKQIVKVKTLNPTEKFFKENNFLGSIISIKDVSDWAKGKRKYVYTNRNDYLIYYLDSKIVSIYVTDPLRKKIFNVSEPKIELKETKNLAIKYSKLKNQFSVWNGSHTGLTRYIKDHMNDPGSYKHVDTNILKDSDNYFIIETSFRGKNAFGAKVLNTLQAKIDYNGNILEISN